MSSLKFIFGLLAISFMIWSCEMNTSNGSDSEKASNENSSVVDTISLETFTAWRNKWASDGAAYMASDSLVYFDMSIIDLQEVINSGADSARFYIGLETEKSEIFPHLMMVGVDSTGQENLNLILDYSKSCPPYCPK